MCWGVGARGRGVEKCSGEIWESLLRYRGDVGV